MASINQTPPNPPMANLTSTPGCFEILSIGPVSLFVGPSGGPATCPVVGNTSGCPFNPTIFDADVLASSEGPVIPALSQWGLLCFGLLLLSAMFVAWRGRMSAAG